MPPGLFSDIEEDCMLGKAIFLMRHLITLSRTMGSSLSNIDDDFKLVVLGGNCLVFAIEA